MKYNRILDGIIDGEYASMSDLVSREFATALHPRDAAGKMLKRLRGHATLLLRAHAEQNAKPFVAFVADLEQSFLSGQTGQTDASEYDFLFLRHCSKEIASGRAILRAPRRLTALEAAWSASLAPLTPSDIVGVLCELVEIEVSIGVALKEAVASCFDAMPDKSRVDERFWQPVDVNYDVFREEDISVVAHLLANHWGRVLLKRRPFGHLNNSSVRRINVWMQKNTLDNDGPLKKRIHAAIALLERNGFVVTEVRK